MSTRQIPREDWKPFLDTFSDQHEGWLVSLEVIDPELGAQVEALEVPLRGISAEVVNGGPNLISISLGHSADERTTHNISNPSAVRLRQTDDGGDEALQVERADGGQTVLRFRSAVLPS